MTARFRNATIGTRGSQGLAAIGCMLTLLTATPGPVHGAEQDLTAGLAHLRAGSQAQAAHDLARYREGERDPDVRRSIDRVLRLLKQPLSEDLREYIALSVEEKVRAKAASRGSSARSGFLSRMFPVFP